MIDLPVPASLRWLPYESQSFTRIANDLPEKDRRQEYRLYRDINTIGPAIPRDGEHLMTVVKITANL